MSRGRVVYVPDEAHRRLRLLAAKRERSMGEVVAALVEQEFAELLNPWTNPDGLVLQQKILAGVWADPDLDIYNDD